MIDPKPDRLIGQFPCMRTDRESLEVMRMGSRSYMPDPWLLPVIEQWGTRYVADPKGHFRQLSSPFEVID